MAFAIVDAGTFLTAPASFICANRSNDYILAYLCSKVGTYYVYKNSDTTGAGDIMLNIQSLIKFPIPQSHNNFINVHVLNEIDEFVYHSYSFNQEEIEYIECHI